MLALRSGPAAVHRIFRNETPGEWRKRLAEIGWVLGFIHDLEYDFQSILHIDDMYSMPGPKFFRFANRTIYSPGLVRFRHEQIIAKQQGPQTDQRPDRELYGTTPAPKPTPSGRVVASSKEEFLNVMRMKEGSKIMTPATPV